MDWATLDSERGEGRPIRVTVDSRMDLFDDLEGRLSRGEGFAVATLNLDHVVKLRQDAGFRAAYARQTHVTADGNPIVWLSRLAGRRVELVPGSEIVLPMAQLAARAGVPVALFGSTEASLDRAARALAGAVPGLNVAARIAPPMGFDPAGPDADAAIAEIEASGARLCFVALGAPKQEIFAARAHDRAPGIGFLSIGAGLDFLSGAQTRAPALVRALAAEWIWRLAGNPRRLASRYWACVKIMPRLTRAALRERAAGGRA